MPFGSGSSSILERCLRTECISDRLCRQGPNASIATGIVTRSASLAFPATVPAPMAQPMKLTTIRFPENQYDLIRQIAETRGITVSQFIRDCAFAQCVALELLAYQTEAPVQRGEAIILAMDLTNSFIEHPELHDELVRRLQRFGPSARPSPRAADDPATDSDRRS